MISTFSTKIAGLFVQGKLNHFPPGIDGLHDDTCAKELGSVKAVGARLRSYFTSSVPGVIIVLLLCHCCHQGRGLHHRHQYQYHQGVGQGQEPQAGGCFGRIGGLN